MREAATALEHRWAVRRQGSEPPPLSQSKDPPRRVIVGTHRFPGGLFHQSPVDLLFIERGTQEKGDGVQPSHVETVLHITQEQDRPKYIVEAWNCASPMWNTGPVSKLVITRWKKLGYDTHCRWVQASQVGGAVNQARLLVVRVSQRTGTVWDWTPIQNAPPRPMSNLLIPPGLIPSWVYQEGRTGPDVLTELMPSAPGRWITTPHGVRRLETGEFIHGLGGPSAVPPIFGRHPFRKMAVASTSLFHWEYVTSSLVESIVQSRKGVGQKKGKLATSNEIAQRSPARPHDGPSKPSWWMPRPKFSWQPPDLTPGKRWHSSRVQNLKVASRVYPSPNGKTLNPEERSRFEEHLISEGLEDLAQHRLNYDAVGPNPTKLKLLWWEWPHQHWVPLREGSRMNFVQQPPKVIHANSPMDKDQQKVAEDFVEELVSLGTLAPLGEGEVVSTAPLFCIPKEGQPGQWRVIADMLRGGQNGCIANDPVYLPRHLHILAGMYEGGFSASVDASKFFYQFPTHPEDRPFLGIRHPKTNQLLAYHGLPMGSGNSPALGNRYGLAFIRKVCDENRDIFQGKLVLNGFFAEFSKPGTYHPEMGEGYVIYSKSGYAVKIWAFVDDFLIHAPTEALCQEALTAFLDAAVDCGMLCHPLKLVAPCQAIRYCGFIFDHSGVPTLKIPRDKLERSNAMIDYTLAYPDREWSRLALAVLAGVLESLAECTPQRIGHTHLRSLHGLIHQEDTGGGLEVYLSTTRLGPEVASDLEWWRDHLTVGEGRVVRAQSSGTLVPTFGDGSGTGTGGTIMLPDQPLTMWKGQWAPTVFAFSSNWKEITTLVLTLDHLSATDPDAVKGTTLFYFTDNSATYWICQKGSSKHPHLHEQVLKIRALETKMRCQLWVVHVPGKVMITEGTDGLSRGIWITSLHKQIPREVLLPGIFAPLPFDPILVNSYVHEEIPAYHAANGGHYLAPPDGMGEDGMNHGKPNNASTDSRYGCPRRR